MKRTLRQRLLYNVGVVLGVAPLLASAIPILQAHDFRILWMTLAALFGILLVPAIVQSQSRRALVTLISATVFAGVTGFLLGARHGPGVWMVALAIGVCWAGSYALFDMSENP